MAPLIKCIACVLLFPIVSIGADVEIQGRIVSASNAPVAGVNVLVMGTARGTASNMDGYFTLSVPEGSVALLFNYRKHKPLEHRLEVRDGYQYQVNVILATNVQTFSRSEATSGELPLSAPVIAGIVLDQNHNPLAGAIITQESNTFRTTTNVNGRFSLALSSGENKLSVTYRDLKPLYLPVNLEKHSRYTVEVMLIEDVKKHRTQASTAALNKNP